MQSPVLDGAVYSATSITRVEIVFSSDLNNWVGKLAGKKKV